MRITPALLEAAHLSEEQVSLFAAEWPDGVLIDEASVRRAQELGANLDSLVAYLFGEPAYFAYVGSIVLPLRAIEAGEAAASKAYCAVAIPARARLEAEIAPALARYQEELARTKRAGRRSEAAWLRSLPAADAARRAMQAAIAGPTAAYEATVSPVEQVYSRHREAAEEARLAVRRQAFLGVCRHADLSAVE